MLRHEVQWYQKIPMGGLTMLYPRNQEPTLSEELFRCPGSEYRGTPFWAWNCRLEREELLRQLDILKQMGMGGAHMHVRPGMATPYLSDEHMALIKACVEKCREENMLAWLYDEDRWPSGAAGGLVTKDPKYRQRMLLWTARPYGSVEEQAQNYEMSGGAGRSGQGTLLACYDVILDENGCLQSAERIDTDGAAAGRKWYAYVETPLPNPWFNDQTYVDTLNPEAMRKFIAITYERYLQTVGADFGGVVPAIFTDEPQFTTKGTLSFAQDIRDVVLPWTDDLPETFQSAYGEDLLAALPELFWELPDGKRSVTRYHYHDHVAERFAASFADQCGKWCEDHGLMLTGHMMEEPTLQSQTHSLGDCMRSYRSFQLPGIDMLCGSFEFTTAKQAQSAVRQYGRAGMVSELYGVTGWAFDLRGHKIHGDWQAALGVTVRVPHLSWVSMKGEAKRDYPASISYQSPWWQDYTVVEDHFARVNTALTRGKALVKVGVLHPVESYWLHWGPKDQTMGIRQELDTRFRDLTDWLLTGSIDFDFISESLLPELCPAGGAPLQVGRMAYDTIVVPGCETLRSTTLERLEAFRKAGGRLLFLGDAPTLENAVLSNRGRQLWEQSVRCSFGREAVLQALEQDRILELRNADGRRTDNLLHQLREDAGGLWLFLAHGQDTASRDLAVCQQVRIAVKGLWSVRLYDTSTGAIRPMAHSHENGKTILTAELYDCDSLLLRLDTPGEPVPLPEKPEFTARPLPVAERVTVRLEEPNALLLDKAEFALDDGPYQPAMELLRADNVLRAELGLPDRQGAVTQPWAVKEEVLSHTVRLRFTVDCAVAVQGTRLALEDAELARIKVNGQPVTAKPEGWFVDRAIGTVALPELQPGDNTIEVSIPFGRRTNVEWHYLLGDFGVELQGSHRTVTAPVRRLGFDDIVRQKLPHYTGNLSYELPVTTRGGRLRVTVPHYSGAGIRVSLDGAAAGHILYPPYVLELNAPAGDHVLTLTLLGNRENAFGPIHWQNEVNRWIGPDAWRSEGSQWTESYVLKPLGIRSAPKLEELKR